MDIEECNATNNCYSTVLEDQVYCNCYSSDVKLEVFVNIEPEGN